MNQPPGWGAPPGPSQPSTSAWGPPPGGAPPGPPKRSRTTVIAAVVGVAAGLCCVGSMLARSPAPAPAAPPGQPAFALPPNVNMNNPAVADAYRRAGSIQEARTTIAAMGGLADPSIESSVPTGERYENATFVTPRCTAEWITEFVARPVPRPDYHGLVAETMRDAGFDRIQCVRSAMVGQQVVAYTIPR